VGYFFVIFTKLPKENNCPLGENSLGTGSVPHEPEQEEDGGPPEDSDESHSGRSLAPVERADRHRDAEAHDPHEPGGGWGPGLPDGIFSNQNSKFEKIFKSLAIEDVSTLYGHTYGLFYGILEYFVAIWYILW
jgi:hypothetical protein